jgi:hypothetical protein
LALANSSLGVPVAPYDALTVLEIALQTSIVFTVIQVVFALGAHKSSSSTPMGWLGYFLINFVSPVVLIALLALTRYKSEDTVLFSSSIFLFAGLASVAVLMRSASRGLGLLFIKQKWLSLVLTFSLVAAATLLIKLYLVYPPQFLMWLAVPAGAAAFAVLGDQLSRRANYHEVSLVRAYGFYGRFSAINFTGFFLSAIAGFALSEGFVWSDQVAQYRLDFIGPLTGVLVSASIAFAWTATLGRFRVTKQELEIAKVERRKNELAGLDEIVGLP